MSTETSYQRSIRRAREQFVASTADHKMTVLLDTLDDGKPYRHLRFARPGTGMWSFNIVTWPGYLALTGDIGGHTFSRLHDMVAFFRGRGSINPSYWGEKLVAEQRGVTHGQAQFSSEVFVEVVQNHIDDCKRDLSDEEFAALNAYAAEQLTDVEYYGDRSMAIDALNGFVWESEEADVRIRFSDAWEYDLGGYDHHFLLACHAVQYGVNAYLAAYPDRFIPEGGSTPLHLAPKDGAA